MMNELEKMLEEYDKHFSSFPTIPLLRTYSAEENIDTYFDWALAKRWTIWMKNPSVMEY